MWWEILCGLFLYQLYRIFSDNDDVLDVETSDSSALFAVAEKLRKLYGGKVYVGLRIPDPDTSSRQNIDLVLVNKKGEAMVIAVNNFSGFISVNPDGTWVTESYNHKHKKDQLPDPVVETRRQASILESYLEQRGVALPHEFFTCKVILSNPKVCIIHSSNFPEEIITYDQWVKLKPDPTSALSGWIKGTISFGKKAMDESTPQKLNSILSTAPTWDRLELKGNKYVLGEFLEFKGDKEEVQALRKIKRSKIGNVIIQKTSMLGFAPSRLQVLYSPRDYRSEGASASEWKELNVKSSTEVVFQPGNSAKVRKIKLSSIISMTLSA